MNLEQQRIHKRFYYKQDAAVEKPFNWKQMARLLGYMKPYAKTILPKAIVAMTITTAVRLFVPILIGVFAFDYAIKNRDALLLTTLVAITAVLYVIRVC